jgi:hypothetical protein
MSDDVTRGYAEALDDWRGRSGARSALFLESNPPPPQTSRRS